MWGKARAVRNVGTRAALVALLFAVGMIFVSGAAAVHNSGHFELEGDIVDIPLVGGPDWASQFDAAGNSLVGPDCAFAQDDLSQSGLTDDTIFIGSNKNNDLIQTWRWGSGNNPPKDDLSNVYTCATFNTAGELLLYAGAERLAPEGASHIDFQFYKDEISLDKAIPCGTDQSAGPTDSAPCEFVNEKQVGDFVVSVDFTNGGAIGSMTVRVWNGTEYVPLTSTSAGCNTATGTLPADAMCAFSNTTPITGGPWPSYDRFGNVIPLLEPQMFTEFGINLTQVLGSTPCIATFIVKTRSSPSFTSELKDFALVPFNTCPSKSGTKYHDLNADGDRDAGEPGLEGWEIRAYADTDGDGVLDVTEATTPADTDVTDADGNYSLTFEPGEYVVCEVLKAGWNQSEPSALVPPAPPETLADCSAGAGLAPNGYAIDLGPNQEATGNDFGNFQQAAKTGVKFEDLDADGVKDANEPGLSGWTITAYVDANGNGVRDSGENTVAATTTTGTGGTYTLDLAPGNYVVCETQQSGWTQSFPANNACGTGMGGWGITLTSQQLDSGNDFGNFRLATKSGMKFHDLNANGIKDAGEPGLQGWTITAFVDADGDGVLDAGEITVADSDATDASGNYSLSLAPGDYVVCEQLQADWLQSFPAGSACAAGTGLGAAGYGITLDSGEVETGNDFGNYQLATKTGTKFHDLDADGVKDAGEGGLAGWTIEIYEDENVDGALDAGDSLVTSETTDANGVYSFDVDPGRYIVCEVQQQDWTQSYPANTVCGPAAGGWAITLTSGQIDSGNDFGNYTTASKTGVKFHDLNANGTRDAGEPGLENWRIYVDVNDNGQFDTGEPTALTAADGTYTITGIQPGVEYKVREVQQAGWTCSRPSPCFYTETFVSGQTEQNNDFGNWTTATKSGTKYHDRNADGDRDAGEEGLRGWTINAYVDANGNGVRDAGEDTVAASGVTDGTGAYSLTLNPGRYVVCEVQQSGWIQSDPAGTACGPNAGGHRITLVSQEVDSGNDFGNYQRATKSGTKWNDLDADGVRDAGEPGLAGWVIRAYVDENGNGTLQSTETTVAAQMTTGAGGAYSFSLDPGKYVVCEVLQAAWIQSFPANAACQGGTGLAAGGHGITLISQEVDSGNDFGNWRAATKSGTKFHDLNANGARDAGEPGLAGWTIYVDYDDDSQLDGGEPSAVTAAGGAYLIGDVNPGTYKVREVQQAGWFCSFPNPCFYTETFLSESEMTGNDFGNFQRATKSGTKFHDLNANGASDAGEPGLPGWTVNAYVDANGNGVRDAGENTVAATTTTGAGGAYSMSLDPGRYVVCEVQQTGWIQSHPAGAACGQGAGGHAITLVSQEVDAGNDFGNYQRATKSGTKFHDLNRNGTRDAGEPGLAGWTIRAYADANANGQLEAGEAIAAAATTDAAGAYSLSLVPGRYVVCELLQATWRQEAPRNTVCAAVAGLGAGGHAISLVSGETDAGNDFGNSTIINLAITKTDAPDPVLVGEQITYTVTVRNTSQHTATEVVVTDPLPLDRVSFVSAASSQGTCTGVAPMTCALGTLAPGASATITIVVRANVTGTVTNPARVVAREEEETLADNEAQTTTLVVAPLQPPRVCASLTLDRRGATVGRRVTVRAVVRDTARATMAGQRVIARGAGVNVAARTNAAGVARLTIRPRSAGVVRFRVAGTTVCTARVTVKAVFRPPLTGRTSG